MKTTEANPMHCWICKDFDGTETPATHRLIVRPGHYGFGEDAMPICTDCVEGAISCECIIVRNDEYETTSEGLLFSIFPVSTCAGDDWDLCGRRLAANA